MRETWPTHLILIDKIILIYLAKSTNFRALHYAVFSSLLSFFPLLGPCTLFSDILTKFILLKVRDEVPRP